MENSLNRAIALARAGDKVAARTLLRQIVDIEVEPDNEVAWGWLAHCAENLEERRLALARVVAINPNNVGAVEALNKLLNAPPYKLPLDTMQTDDSHLLDQEIARLTGRGWQVVSRTPTGAQLRKPKQWHRGMLLLGLLTLIVFGVGLIFWLIALVDYLLKRDQLVYIAAQDVRLGTIEIPLTWRKPVMLALAIMGLFALVLFCFMVVMPLITGTF